MNNSTVYVCYQLKQFQVRNTFKLYSVMVALGKKSLSGMFNEKKRQKLQAWHAVSSTAVESKRVRSVTEWAIFRRGARKRFPCNTRKIVKLAIKSKHQIQEDGSIKGEDVENKVNCLVLRAGRSTEFDDVLILHLHGGGWTAGRPAVHEGYLRKIAVAMPGATIVW